MRRSGSPTTTNQEWSFAQARHDLVREDVVSTSREAIMVGGRTIIRGNAAPVRHHPCCADPGLHDYRHREASPDACPQADYDDRPTRRDRNAFGRRLREPGCVDRVAGRWRCRTDFVLETRPRSGWRRGRRPWTCCSTRGSTRDTQSRSTRRGAVSHPAPRPQSSSAGLPADHGRLAGYRRSGLHGPVSTLRRRGSHLRNPNRRRYRPRWPRCRRWGQRGKRPRPAGNRYRAHRHTYPGR